MGSPTKILLFFLVTALTVFDAFCEHDHPNPTTNAASSLKPSSSAPYYDPTTNDVPELWTSSTPDPASSQNPWVTATYRSVRSSTEDCKWTKNCYSSDDQPGSTCRLEYGVDWIAYSVTNSFSCEGRLTRKFKCCPI